MTSNTRFIMTPRQSMDLQSWDDVEVEEMYQHAVDSGVHDLSLPQLDLNFSNVLEGQELLPETAEFGNIPKGDWHTCLHMLNECPFISNEAQKNLLLLESFDAFRTGNKILSRRIMWNAALLWAFIARRALITQYAERNDWASIANITESIYVQINRALYRALNESAG